MSLSLKVITMLSYLDMIDAMVVGMLSKRVLYRELMA